MRKRATRPNVFRDLKRFGVYSTDWKYILVPTAVMYVTPFILGLWLYYIPLGFPLGVATFLILLVTFSILRASKPRYWLKHRLDAASDGWTRFRPPLNREFQNSDWITKPK